MALEDLRPQAERRSREELLNHLKSFELELKFSAGIRSFSPQTSRYHEAYKPELGLERRLQIAAAMTPLNNISNPLAAGLR